MIFLCGHENTPSPITLIIPLGVKVRCPKKRANTHTLQQVWETKNSEAVRIWEWRSEVIFLEGNKDIYGYFKLRKASLYVDPSSYIVIFPSLCPTPNFLTSPLFAASYLFAGLFVLFYHNFVGLFWYLTVFIILTTRRLNNKDNLAKPFKIV